MVWCGANADLTLVMLEIAKDDSLVVVSHPASSSYGPNHRRPADVDTNHLKECMNRLPMSVKQWVLGWFRDRS